MGASSPAVQPAPAQHRRAPTPADPDARLFRAASRRIGIRVGLLSAGLIALGAAVLVVAVWWKTSQDTSIDPKDTVFTVGLDVGDLVVAGAALAIAAVLVAGAVGFLLARRPVAPLEESMRRQRAFVADASHELRTPIAVVSARAQQLQLMALGDERLSPVVAELRTDCDQLTGIVDDLLAAASPAPGAPDGAPGSARLDAVAGQVAQDLRVLAAPRQVGIDIDAPAVSVGLGPAPLARCLTALVDNAVGHSPDGARVVLRATARGSRAEIRVIDEGPGITGIDPEAVFDRFSHGTAPAHPGRSSHGIGLALVRDAAARAGGSASVESTGPAGTTMLLVLPIVEEES